MIICAHILVKNEAKYIWYTVMSVLPHVDRIRLWDMGSTDETKKIINKILKHPQAKNKIFYKHTVVQEFDEQKIRLKMLEADSHIFTWARKSMLEVTTADWIIMVDGDEVWWDESIKKLVDLIHKKGDQLESIVVPAIIPIGDIFHFQENRAGGYNFDTASGSVTGHYSLRAINRKIPGLSSLKPHGQWGWTDGDGKMIQYRDPNKIAFINAPYMHFTHLPRAGSIKNDTQVIKRKMKLKQEIGTYASLDYYYPEVFFKSRPSIVSSPWVHPSFTFKLLSYIKTPLRKIKRRLVKRKVGY